MKDESSAALSPKGNAALTLHFVAAWMDVVQPHRDCDAVQVEAPRLDTVGKSPAEERPGIVWGQLPGHTGALPAYEGRDQHTDSHSSKMHTCHPIL